MRRIILYIFSLLILPLSATAQTQDVAIRYVTLNGSYGNDGTSWETAKSNIQDAINSLKDYIDSNDDVTSGCVYVGAGVYTPTESTEASGGNVLYTSFKIYGGISVYGGFTAEGKKGTFDTNGNFTADTPVAYQQSPDDRYMSDGRTQREIKEIKSDTLHGLIGRETPRAWDFHSSCVTQLSGKHVSYATSDYLTWDATHNQYTEAYPGNSYHVVWFATNGFIEGSDVAADQQQHAKPLAKPALIDGFVISGGNASIQRLDQRYHTAYGGGVYMTKNATVRNCRIYQNSAARRGGGIYLDGGGTVDHCFIQKNQAKGIGLTDGNGGGVCIDQEGVVRHSVIVDNVGGVGGGLAINHKRTEYPCSAAGQDYFSTAFAPSAVGCVVANNTALIEGGGMAMLSGGTVNHMTIVRNHCAGSLVSISNRRYGRSGGLFVDVGGVMFNSVVWGNTTAANGNVQYSAYVPTDADEIAGAGVQPYLLFSAFSNHDESDWTGTYKQSIVPLEFENARINSGRDQDDYYPEFGHPSTLVGGIAGAGASGTEGQTDWVPANHSNLVACGVRLADYVTKRSEDMINAAIEVDIYGNRIAPVSTLGAYASGDLISSIEPAAGIAPIVAADAVPTGKTLMTIFVDPEFERGKMTAQGVEQDGRTIAADSTTARGNSWLNPLVYLADALHYVKYHGQSDTIYQILVKEGTTSVGNRQANTHNSNDNRVRLRDMTMEMADAVRVYGGFCRKLALNATYGGATNVSLRNPHEFPTIISANVTGLDYTDNVAHVVTFDSVYNAIFDGFKIFGGNSTVNNDLYDPWTPAQPGGNGIYIRKGEGNQIRNCFIANCTASGGQGAAILATESTGLKFENLVVHNNSARPTDNAVPAAVLITQGIGTAPTATFDHCLFRGNVGALVSDGSGNKVTVTNTAFHANGTKALEGKNVEGGDLADGGQSGDKLLAVMATNSGEFAACNSNMIDDDLSALISIAGFSAIFNHNPINNANYTYPAFTNPTTTIGVNSGGLVTFYGGTPDFTPDNMSPMVNAANDTGTAKDITTRTTRNRGGKADIGPIENTNLPESGEVIYVRTTGNDSNDGLSWDSPKATIQAALNVADANEVWVAAGTYTENITMVDGVSVYGGFIASGHPGKQLGEERDISNNNPAYKTIIDGDSIGRVLTQDADFTKATVYEGLTITRGKVTGNTYGGGALIRSNTTLRNCLITKNVYYTNTSAGGYGGGGLYTSGTAKVQNCIIRGNLAWADGSGLSGLTSGGGAYIAGGTFINSMVVENENRTKRSGTSQLGGAMYIADSANFYNCTVAYNFGNNISGGGATVGGLWDNSKSSKFYNCIFWGNYGRGTTAESFMHVAVSGISSGGTGANPNLFNCYQSAWDNSFVWVGTGESKTADLVYTFPNGSTSNSSWDAYRDSSYVTSPFVDPRNGDFSLASGTGNLGIYCINTGKYEDKLSEQGITEDITGAARIQDCTIDKGAYEYNGANDITPDVTSESSKAIYYVTETGKGLASANSPANAACAGKLQLVLDAAGRYKYANPNVEVVVRVAGYGNAAASTGYTPTHEVVYDDYAGRLRDADAVANPLMYSLLVPRGITIEGGWDSDFNTREPLTHPTVLTGQYTAANGTSTNAYHTLTFTDLVYDKDREPIKNGTAPQRLGEGAGRAIIDGCFITGGNAAGQEIDRKENAVEGVSGYQLVDSYYNPNNYGGAAIVPSYGHIRNCVLQGNTATDGGGALMLKPRALVSGSIFTNNTTNGDGGAVLVYEPATADSIALCDSDALDPSTKIDLPSITGPKYRYANIFTSTFVENTAKRSGGAVSFENNLRMNSSVLWHNTANSNANIDGTVAPGEVSGTDLAPWQYPLQFCAVENRRVPGYNNISVNTDKDLGVRWADTDSYYPLKNYSLLVRTGMLMSDYDTISIRNDYFPTLSRTDIAGVAITGHSANNYIEIGARSLDADINNTPTSDANVMTRLFVAKAEKVDLEKAEKLQTSGDAYYSMVGSSMLNPFNRLDDAFDYIIKVRKLAQTDAALATFNNQTFELFISDGVYYPYRTVKGVYANTRANTFLIPEGVAVYGGIDNSNAYCKETTGTKVVNGVTLAPVTTTQILNDRNANDYYDVNQNGIVEGWEFLNQTILSGDIINTTNSKNVFHVITALAAEEYVGKLPTAVTTTDGTWDGSFHKERGLPIILDGLQVTSGEAVGYESSVLSQSTYYKGGAICVDGSWYSQQDGDGNYTDLHREQELTGYPFTDDPNEVINNEHNRVKRSKGYRDIPLVIRNSLITNNKACMGGAVFTNGELNIFSSQLSQNTAMMYFDEQVEYVSGNKHDMLYFGRGGAVDASSRVVCANTIFANNTATSSLANLPAAVQTELNAIAAYKTVFDDKVTSHNFYDKNGIRQYLTAGGTLTSDTTGNTPATYYVPNSTGGAICMGEYGSLKMLNCDVVNNEADGYPAIYTFAPNAGYKVNKGTDGKPASLTCDTTVNTNFIVNSVFWGNQNNIENSVTSNTSHYEWLMNPVSSYRYEGDLTAQRPDLPEALWFCAYEPGTWYEPLSYSFSDDANDFRRMDYTRGRFVPDLLLAKYKNSTSPSYPDTLYCYNFNVHINRENGQPDGPNFIKPSNSPGADGYMPSADWMMGRINNLVDQGWTYAAQASDGSDMDFTGSYSGPYAKMAADYNTSNGTVQDDPEYFDNQKMAPIGSQTYMRYAQDASAINRISIDPNPTHLQTYIDIGAYEYKHRELNISEGEDIDVLWVAPEETGGVCDGSSWATATSDLQRAIETLLASRNGHKKEIRMRSGVYMPVYTIDNALAFTIDTRSLNNQVINPSKDEAKGVESLTIRGGYDNNVQDSYDVEQYPAYMQMAQRSGVPTNEMQHLFYIKDAQQYKTLITGSEQASTAKGVPVPIILEGIVFTNTTDYSPTDGSGMALYYAANSLDPHADGKPKITVKNCIFAHNGNMADTETSNDFAAATIMRGGGKSLIYNTLFHHNAGSPLIAYDTDVVNCTFALNESSLVIQNSGSEALYNNIIWKNGYTPVNGSVTQEIVGSPSQYNNAILGFSSNEDDDTNVALSDINNDVFTGPNFVDPDNDNFHIYPSVLITSKADTLAYYHKVLGIGDGSAAIAWGEGTGQVSLSKSLKAGYTTTYGSIYTNEDLNGSSTEKKHQDLYLDYRDLAGKQRLYGKSMERGAYESQTLQNRVMYLLPSRSGDGYTGESWEKAYGGDNLQTAINAGAVYKNTETGDAYIFVRGNDDFNMGEITLYNGVNLIGSIQSGFLSEVEAEADGTYADAKIVEYIGKVRNTADRAMAGPTTKRSAISGVTATATRMTALIDGFDITPKSGDATPRTTPAVTVGAGAGGVALRDCILHDYTTAAGVPIIRLQGMSLLYNSLLRDVSISEETPATPTPIVEMPADESDCHVYVVNCTASYPAGYTLTGLADWSDYGSKHYFNSLAYAGDAAAATSPFAPYFRSSFERFEKDKNLWYQLHEDSEHIGQGSTAIAAWPKEADRGFVNGYINFATDRDLLGNPRIIDGSIDVGCFETWSTSSTPLTPNTTNDAANYYGNYYPHDGSVVYIQRNGVMALGTNFGPTQPFKAGYLLLREGGSLYGQGSSVALSYVAVERELPNRYGLVSLPYKFKLSAVSGYDAYTYDGETRSGWTYKYNSSDSPCWQPVAGGDSIEANRGWLIDLKDEEAGRAVRFTGIGNLQSDWIYKEGTVGDKSYTPKAVTLVQYDARTSTNGTAHFTHEYNMGWNLAGLPYLVSGYKTGLDADGNYQMNVPHMMYTVNAEGGYATSESWDDDATLSVGGGFFTQTAKLVDDDPDTDDDEKLTFALPVYTAAQSAASSAPRVNISRAGSRQADDRIEVHAAQENGSLGYTLGADGAKFMAMNDSLAQLYVVGTESLRMSLLSAAPTETEIPLGLSIPATGDYTLSVPQGSDWGEYTAWLVDKQQKSVANLVDEPCTVALDNGDDCIGRFYLVLSASMPRLDDEPAQGRYTVTGHNGTITVEGLSAGDKIAVYTTNSIKVTGHQATQGSWQTEVLPHCTYIVVVNNFVKKLYVD